jgi:hypothetical protein
MRNSTFQSPSRTTWLFFLLQQILVDHFNTPYHPKDTILRPTSHTATTTRSVNDLLADESTSPSTQQYSSPMPPPNDNYKNNPSIAPDSYPIILNHSENTSAVSWATKTISSSTPIAKHIARIACFLQLKARLGLKVAYIEGENNNVSDDSSRMFFHPHSPLSSLSDPIQSL